MKKKKLKKILNSFSKRFSKLEQEHESFRSVVEDNFANITKWIERVVDSHAKDEESFRRHLREINTDTGLAHEKIKNLESVITPKLQETIQTLLQSTPGAQGAVKRADFDWAINDIRKQIERESESRLYHIDSLNNQLAEIRKNDGIEGGA